MVFMTFNNIQQHNLKYSQSVLHIYIIGYNDGYVDHYDLYMATSMTLDESVFVFFDCALVVYMVFLIFHDKIQLQQ